MASDTRKVSVSISMTVEKLAEKFPIYQTSKPDKMSKRRFGKVMRRMGRKHGQESVITKDKDKPAKLHYTEKGSKAKSDSIGKSKAGKHPEGYGETSGTKVRGGKLPKKTNKSSYHYG